MMVKLELYILRTGYHRPVCRCSGSNFGINGFKSLAIADKKDRIGELMTTGQDLSATTPAETDVQGA